MNVDIFALSKIKEILPMLSAKMIGNKIAEARKKINISQAALAQHLFISAQAVGKWERGESMPDITTLNRLAEILEVDLNYFSESFSSENKEVVATESVENQSADLPSIKQKAKPGWNMSNGNWVDADFSGLKHLDNKFSSSNMQRCKFIGSDLSGLLLKSNNVAGCNFSDSNLSGSHVQHSHIANSIFSNCNLKNAQFSGSYMSDCDFSGADFTEVRFNSGGMAKNNITDAAWKHTSFVGMKLDDITFNGTIEDCHFENCDFKWVTFKNVTLINTFFRNNRFKWLRTKFIDCQADRLTYELLKSGKADISGISLLTS